MVFKRRQNNEWVKSYGFCSFTDTVILKNKGEGAFFLTQRLTLETVIDRLKVQECSAAIRRGYV